MHRLLQFKKIMKYNFLSKYVNRQLLMHYIVIEFFFALQIVILC